MNLPWLDVLKTRLSASLDQQRLGHAPMLTGPTGVGKVLLGEWLARRILCLQPNGRDPCLTCRSCQLIDSGSHPDFFRVGIPEEKKEIPVDSVRELCASLQLTPRMGPRRLGLIEPAEAMNINAANALLKTLEEPSANAFVVLISHQPGRLPATIRSRCQPIPVRPPEPQAALAWLSESCGAADEQSLKDALALTMDAPLAARELLEGDGLTFGREVLDGLLAIGAGRPVTSIMTEGWLQSTELTWRWLAVWTGVMMHHGQGLDSGRLPSGLTLPTINGRALGGLWENALRGRALTRTSARQDLLMAKWLLEWEALIHAEN
jgi:DNA polymerase-3 subunit delta'